MNLLSSVSVYILLTQATLVLSKSDFGKQELNLKFPTNQKREMKIRELSDRLGLKYEELLTRNRKHRRHMRELKLPTTSNVRGKLAITERQLIGDFLVSQRRSRLIPRKKNTVVPTKRKSSKKIKFNLGNISKIFKSSSVNTINKDIDSLISKNNKKEKNRKFTSSRKSFTKENSKIDKKTRRLNKRPTKRRNFRLNIFQKRERYKNSNRRQKRLNVSILSSLTEQTRSTNEKQNLHGRVLQKPLTKLEFPDRSTKIIENKHNIFVKRTKGSESSQDQPDRKRRKPKIKLRNKLNEPETTNIPIPVLHKIPKQKNRPDKRIETPKINLRGMFEKSKRNSANTPTVRKSQAPKNRHYIPEKRIDSFTTNIKLRNMFDKPEKNSASTPTIRKSQAPNNMHDHPEKRKETKKINLRSMFEKQKSPQFLIQPKRPASIIKPKTMHDTPISRSQAQKIKLQNKFDIPPKRILRNFMNAIKIRKNKNEIKPVFITRGPSRRYTTTTTAMPTTKRMVTIRKTTIPFTTTSATTQTTSYTTRSTTTTLRPTIGKVSTDDLKWNSRFKGVDPIKNSEILNSKTPDNNVPQRIKKIQFDFTNLRQKKIPETSSEKTKTRRKEGPKRMRLTFSSFPTSSSRTTSKINRLTAKPTDRIELRLDSFSFPTGSSTNTKVRPRKVSSTTTDIRSQIRNKTNVQDRPTVDKTNSTISLNIVGRQKLGKSVHTVNTGPSKKALSKISSISSQKSKASLPTKFTRPRTKNKIRFSLQSLPPTPSNSVDNSATKPTGQSRTTKIRFNFSKLPSTPSNPFDNNAAKPTGQTRTTKIRFNLPSLLSNPSNPANSGAVKPTGQTRTTKIRLGVASLLSSSSPVDRSTLSSPSQPNANKQSELSSIETEILNQLRKTPEFVHASQVNTPEADMKLKEVLDGLLFNFSTNLASRKPIVTTNQKHSGGLSGFPGDIKMSTVRGSDLKDALSTVPDLKRAMLIPKRFSQPTVSRNSAKKAVAGKSDWMFIQSELNNVFPE